MELNLIALIHGDLHLYVDCITDLQGYQELILQKVCGRVTRHVVFKLPASWIFLPALPPRLLREGVGLSTAVQYVLCCVAEFRQNSCLGSAMLL